MIYIRILNIVNKMFVYAPHLKKLQRSSGHLPPTK